ASRSRRRTASKVLAAYTSGLPRQASAGKHDAADRWQGGRLAGPGGAGVGGGVDLAGGGAEGDGGAGGCEAGGVDVALEPLRQAGTAALERRARLWRPGRPPVERRP